MKTTHLAAALVLALSAMPAAAQDQETAMEAYLELSQPGKMHEVLHKVIGDWTYTARVWAVPGAPVSESKGTMSAEALLGGRFVKEEWDGEMMGLPFSGIGINGFDVERGKFSSHWMDNLSTIVTEFEGECVDASCSGIEMTSSVTDPSSGRSEVLMRMRSSWEGDDRFTTVSYMTTPDGGEFKNMEIVAVRK